jgi:hypothetical protein
VAGGSWACAEWVILWSSGAARWSAHPGLFCARIREAVEWAGPAHAVSEIDGEPGLLDTVLDICRDNPGDAQRLCTALWQVTDAECVVGVGCK